MDAESTDRSSDALLQVWQETGDTEVLDRLLQLEIQVLKRIIRGRGRDLLQSFGATDAAHEAVLGLLRAKSAPHFDNPRALRGYLWKAAWRLLVARLDKRRRGPLRLEDSAGGSPALLATAKGLSDADEAERAVALDVAMNLLAPADRDLLGLVYFEGLDIPGAAARLGVSLDVANTRLVRARRRLAAKLASWSQLIG